MTPGAHVDESSQQVIQKGGPASNESLAAGEDDLCIPNVDQIPPFLMSLSSDSDMWLFIGSNAGLSAGRINSDHALFPYRPADRILSQPNSAGVGSHFIIDGENWDPWSEGSPHQVTRNLYKHVTGTSVMFEEINHTLELVFRWRIASSEALGLVRNCEILNLTDRPRDIKILDGWHHLLPHGVQEQVYSRFSYLAAAYMRHELEPQTGLGIFTLNSGISDRAEPCESLRVSCAWSLGLDDPSILLSDRQVDAFRSGRSLTVENEIRGEFGAYLAATEITLEAKASKNWSMGADIGLDHAAVIRLRGQLKDSQSFAHLIKQDAVHNILALKRRVAGADGIQQTADREASVHHFANVMFNCMRGGTLHDGYIFPKSDFCQYLRTRNQQVAQRHRAWLESLPDPSSTGDIELAAATQNDPQLTRLVREYLPLCFSRRHGDPSRPWNRFEIRTKDRLGNPIFGYAGNWRDIFQNWESLAHSYPCCFRSMISVFLNASTADGYNPYRITREGIDWEILDPKDPWSHIGYWGDHQIVYLLRLLEGEESYWPGRLAGSLNEQVYAYASVPYRIANLDALLADPRHTISLDEGLHDRLIERSERLGSDGRLCMDADEQVSLVTLGEKLLLPLLVKLSNLVPGGGIWMNTQRPEWNDANNALAGWGLSLVTVSYIRRYLTFLQNVLPSESAGSLSLSEPVAEMLEGLSEFLPSIHPGINDEERLSIITTLGRIGETHRRKVYSGSALEFRSVQIDQVREFLTRALEVIDQTLSANRRSDGMYHSYNLLVVHEDSASIKSLGVMLEGQVAALSSGLLAPAEALQLLKALRASKLYREDQNSYLLYPDRKIASFLERNTLPQNGKTRAPLLEALINADDFQLVVADETGDLHFSSDLQNERELLQVLDQFSKDTKWHDLVERDRDEILALWEEVFHHHEFTGRSGTMFAFEGLGSIYWHMIAKLLLAVQEIHSALPDPASPQAGEFATIYDNIREGLGFTKDARTYGAFPTDPYSHTPRHQGAQQPGMTGQVKEEILTRMTELGVTVHAGRLSFEPKLLKQKEFFSQGHCFEWIGIDGQPDSWELAPNTLSFTLFQTPVCYQLGEEPTILIEYSNGESKTIQGSSLPANESLSLFERAGKLRSLIVTIPENRIQTH